MDERESNNSIHSDPVSKVGDGGHPQSRSETMTELLRRTLSRLENVAASSFTTVGLTLSRHYSSMLRDSPRVQAHGAGDRSCGTGPR